MGAQGWFFGSMQVEQLQPLLGHALRVPIGQVPVLSSVSKFDYSAILSKCGWQPRHIPNEVLNQPQHVKGSSASPLSKSVLAILAIPTEVMRSYPLLTKLLLESRATLVAPGVS